jgi:hypothetical protein
MDVVVCHSLSALMAQQLGNAMPAAALAQVTHIQGQLAIAIDTATLQPRLLEQA